MTTVVCVWFPHWPLQRRAEYQPCADSIERARYKAQPLILHTEPSASGRGTRVVLCSQAAVQHGVRAGMPLAEALALVAGARTTPLTVVHDPAADRDALRELAARCDRFAPLFGLEDAAEPACLLLDATGCAVHFGGEQALVEQLQSDFAEQGFHARVAAAPTIGAAWAAAHYVSRANQAVVVSPDLLAETLDELPIEALRLEAPTVRVLNELGVHGVGQLRRLPRDRLPSRLGPQVLRRLDQTFGRAPELIVAEHPAEPLEVTWAAQEPFRDRLVLLEVCRRLMTKLLAPLVAKRRGVRRLLCQLHACGSRPIELAVGLVSPSHSVKHLSDLLELQLERFPLTEEITFVRLAAAEVVAMGTQPRDLFGHETDHDHECELRRLLERLSNRLGPDAVVRAECVPDAQPELAVTYEPWLGQREWHLVPKLGNPPPRSFASDSSRASEPSVPKQELGNEDQFALFNLHCSIPLRPLRLLPRPQRITPLIRDPPDPPPRFLWNQADYVLRHVWGPERIETGWWRAASGKSLRRDYYRVETTTGEQLWLFRADSKEAWFVHGSW